MYIYNNKDLLPRIYYYNKGVNLNRLNKGRGYSQLSITFKGLESIELFRVYKLLL